MFILIATDQGWNSLLIPYCGPGEKHERGGITGSSCSFLRWPHKKLLVFVTEPNPSREMWWGPAWDSPSLRLLHRHAVGHGGERRAAHNLAAYLL